ncbi:MAG: hypothetical protein HDT47_00485 [Ruminococcaceae bacterium]|nr:hypothetical protein [Oscillospiraceae bacterium]
MKVIIEDENISDVIFNVQFNEGCLSESEAITLSGRRQVDRMGGFKTALKFTVGVIPYSRWLKISESLKKLPVNVKIEINTKTAETEADPKSDYSMSLEGEIPNPYIFSQGGVDHCAGMEIALKEVG